MDDIFTGNGKRKVAIYIRVSTPEQKQDGYSPEHQRKRLLEYVKQNTALNLETDSSLIFEDVGSGNELCREGLDKIRKLVKQKKIQGILVWKIDRLSRNLKHLLTLFEEFQQSEVSFISIQENIDFSGPIGRLIFQMFGAIAQFERELIRGRTYAGKLTSAEQGNFVGGAIPYGYKRVANKSGKGSKLEVIPKEKKWVQQIFDWYIYRQWGDLRIADELNRLKVPIGEGIRQPKVRKWTLTRVRYLLLNEIYYGKHVAVRRDENGRVLTESEQTIVCVSPCISELLYRQAKQARESRNGGYAKNIYLLSGKLRDVSPDLPSPRCFVGVQRTKGGHSYRRKRYKNVSSDAYCQTLEIPGKPLDDYVWSKVMDAFHDPKAFVQRYLQLGKNAEASVTRLEESLKALRIRETEILDKERLNLEEALIKGILNQDRFTAQSAALNKELGEVQSEIQNLQSEMDGIIWAQKQVDNIGKAGKEVLKKLQDLTKEQKKILCDLFVERIEICRSFTPSGKKKVTANIYFRFNPTQFTDNQQGVRTAETLNDKDKILDQGSKDYVAGRYCKSGYTFICLAARQLKRGQTVHAKNRRYKCTKIEWQDA